MGKSKNGHCQSVRVDFYDIILYEEVYPMKNSKIKRNLLPCNDMRYLLHCHFDICRHSGADRNTLIRVRACTIRNLFNSRANQKIRTL